MNKNILFITSSNFPFGGAPANYVRLLSYGLSLQSRTVNVLIQGGRQYGKSTIAAVKKGTYKDVSYKYCCFVNRPKGVFLKIVDNIISAIYPAFYILHNRIRGRLDCVFFYTDSTYISLLAFLCCKLTCIKTIGINVEWFEKRAFLTSKIKYLKWLDYIMFMKIISCYFSGLIVTSRFLRSTYINYGYKSDNIYILPNLTDIEWFQTTNIPILEPKIRKVRVGYSGTPCHKDGIDMLLEAFSIVNTTYSDSELMIIGDQTGKTSVIPDLQDQCRRLGIENDVIFTGLVDYEEVRFFLKSCDILVLARPAGVFAEAGFPTKLGEYLALKKPVVLTKVGDLNYYLKDRYNAVFAEENNANAFAQKILFLIQNKAEARQIGINGFKWVSQILDYKIASHKVGVFIDSF